MGRHQPVTHRWKFFRSKKGLGRGPQSLDHGPGDTDAQELAVEDITNQDANNEPGVEVVYPYQYEESDADVSKATVLWRVPKRLEYDEISSSDLVDSIESLRCDSELEMENEPRRRRRTRDSFGMKRKPSELTDRGYISRSDNIDDAMEDWNSQHTRPRKARRRNPKKNEGNTSRSDSAGGEDDASSNTVTSGETSSDETPLGVTQGDPMDVD